MVKHLLSLALACAALGASALNLNPAHTRNNTLSVRPDNGKFVAAPANLTFSASAEAMRAPASRADEAETSLEFTWAGEAATGYALQGQKQGGELWQAVEIDEATVNSFVGNKITAISLYTPFNQSQINSINNITLFLTHDLTEEPFYTQAATLTRTGFEQATIKLDTPYEIEAGKPVYFGYYFTLNMAAANGGIYYIITDRTPTDNYSAGWVKALGTDGDMVWGSYVDQIGALCISAEITGPNLPRNTVVPALLAAPVAATPGVPFDMIFMVYNNATNKVSSVEVEYTTGTQTKTANVTLLSEIGYHGYGVGILQGITTDVTGVNVPIDFRITKLNGGDENLAADNVATDVFNSLPEGAGYDRTVVIEEGTGTWCGYCPLGITLMEYAAEHYNDGSLIPIAMHNQDDMAIDSYQSIIQTYLSGFPSYVANRDPFYGAQFNTTLQQNKNTLEEIYTELRGFKAVAKVDMSAAYTDAAKTSAKVSVDTEFALANEAGFRIAIVLTEDGMGPYTQQNYLSGQRDYVGYEDFINSGSSFRWIFDDVARFISNPTGVPSSLPVSVEAGQTYHYDFTLGLSGVNPDKCNVIALLINSATGEIENAVTTTISAAGGVDSAVADGTALTVSGMTGAVAFNGEYASASIYNAAGALVATAAGESTVALPAGLYIVKADDTVAKVVVR